MGGRRNVTSIHLAGFFICLYEIKFKGTAWNHTGYPGTVLRLKMPQQQFSPTPLGWSCTLAEPNSECTTLPYGVFKAVVRGSWKHKVSATQLLNVSEALKLRCVDDADKKGMYLNVPMNGIVENLQKQNNSGINI